jgi:hypothetical protein
MLVMLKAAVPVFVSVAAWGELLVPTNWLPNDRGLGDRVTVGATPVPVKATVCGLPLALSFTVSVPVLAPVAVGVKVTSIVQLAPAATLAPHVLVCAKSPLIPMLPIVSAVLAVLLRLIACAPLLVPTNWFPNDRGLGDRVTVDATPVPVKATVCGLPLALSFMVSVPLLVPVAVGVKVTLIVQFVSPAKVVPQVFVSEKSPLLVPAIVMPAMFSVPALVLVSVTALGGLLDPTTWFANETVMGDRLTDGVLNQGVNSDVR